MGMFCDLDKIMQIIQVCKRYWICLLLFGFINVLILYGIYIYDPQSCTFYPKCTLFVMTGWKCPTCGIMRATHCLLHGELQKAIYFNLLLPFFCVSIILIIMFPRFFQKPIVLSMYGFIIVLWGVLRNKLGL